jgi:transposase
LVRFSRVRLRRCHLSRSNWLPGDNCLLAKTSRAGAKLFFLPRYSPDLNPIEQVFAKLKTLLRKTDPRTTEATWNGIGSLLARFKPEESANYLVNAGYASA